MSTKRVQEGIYRVCSVELQAACNAPISVKVKGTAAKLFRLTSTMLVIIPFLGKSRPVTNHLNTELLLYRLTSLNDTSNLLIKYDLIIQRMLLYECTMAVRLNFISNALVQPVLLCAHLSNTFLPQST